MKEDIQAFISWTDKINKEYRIISLIKIGSFLSIFLWWMFQFRMLIYFDALRFFSTTQVLIDGMLLLLFYIYFALIYILWIEAIFIFEYDFFRKYKLLFISIFVWIVAPLLFVLSTFSFIKTTIIVFSITFLLTILIGWPKSKSRNFFIGLFHWFIVWFVPVIFFTLYSQYYPSIEIDWNQYRILYFKMIISLQKKVIFLIVKGINL